MIRKFFSKIFGGTRAPRSTLRSRKLFRRIAIEPLESRRLLAVTGSLSGFAYLDSQDLGVMVPSDAGYPGLTVQLQSVGTLGNLGNVSGVVPEQTAADGSYSFTGLAAGTYQIQVLPSANIALGILSPGSAGGTVGADEIQVELAPGMNATDYNFAILGAPVDTDPVDDHGADGHARQRGPQRLYDLARPGRGQCQQRHGGRLYLCRGHDGHDLQLHGHQQRRDRFRDRQRERDLGHAKRQRRQRLRVVQRHADLRRHFDQRGRQHRHGGHGHGHVRYGHGQCFRNRATRQRSGVRRDHRATDPGDRHARTYANRRRRGLQFHGPGRRHVSDPDFAAIVPGGGHHPTPGDAGRRPGATGNNFTIQGAQADAISLRMFLASTGSLDGLPDRHARPADRATGRQRLSTYTANYTTGTPGVAVAPNATITSTDSPTLTSMTVTIENPASSSDQLSASTTGTTLTARFRQ